MVNKNSCGNLIIPVKSNYTIIIYIQDIFKFEKRSFISLKANLVQEINGEFALSMCALMDHFLKEVLS